jgi:hypothetical protein
MTRRYKFNDNIPKKFNYVVVLICVIRASQTCEKLHFGELEAPRVALQPCVRCVQRLHLRVYSSHRADEECSLVTKYLTTIAFCVHRTPQ